MIKLLTIFNIIAGTSSILGVVAVYVVTPTALPYAFTLPLYIVTLIFSVYVLFVPGSKPEQNVRSKLQRYINPEDADPTKDLSIQRGEFTVTGFNPVSAEFDGAFKPPPAVEIVN